MPRNGKHLLGKLCIGRAQASMAEHWSLSLLIAPMHLCLSLCVLCIFYATMNREFVDETDTIQLRDPQQQNEVCPLPRADGGKDAWLVLGACFIIEGFTYGK